MEKVVFIDEPLRRKNTHDYENNLGLMVVSALHMAKDERIDAVNSGFAGILAEDNTRIKSAQNLPSWIDTPFVSQLSQALKAPVFFDGDVAVVMFGHDNCGWIFNQVFVYI